MSRNLITSGAIAPHQLPLEQLRLEVAAVLKILPERIERLECWTHQIWVKIVESRAKFVSYRVLPVWIEEAIAAIKLCEKRVSLVELGEILRTETQLHHQQYKSVDVERMRQAWKIQADYIKKEEERLQPIEAHQQAGRQWQETWSYVLKYCNSCASLERLAPEIKLQSLEFGDLPDVIGAIANLWKWRWHELTQATA